MPYKVKNRATAEALAHYWQRGHNMSTKVMPGPDGLWYNITQMDQEAIHPLFRELCDAFVSGRCSLGLIAD